MSKDVGTTVKKIVADHLGVDEQKVTDEASFIDDLGDRWKEFKVFHHNVQQLNHN